jgi:Nucleotidyltransferase of unknown function (DUF6036)
VRREDFDHLLAAAAETTGHDEFVVIGSQAIHGTVAQPPDSLLVSIEADIYPLRAPDAAEAVDGALGDGSQFQRTFGFYAHGVGPETAKAPRGWQKRLVKREIPRRVASTRTPVAWCLELHDLVLSKCVAGRERDWEYAAEALKAGLVDPDTLLSRIRDLPVEPSAREHIATMLTAIIATP